MARTYRLFGVELSPYSLKVRAYFRYKRIPHAWIARDTNSQEEYARHARLPLVPLVVTPDGQRMQDSTPIIDHFEARVPDPRLHPADPCPAFLSALIEEYADEWANNQMFHYRWRDAADQRSAAERIARLTRPGLSEEAYAEATEQIRRRMVPRLSFVGSSEATRDHIESSLDRLLAILERHLSARAYLFGGRPSLGDFGLSAQLYQCSTDPTAGALMRKVAPIVTAWAVRMLDPTDERDGDVGHPGADAAPVAGRGRRNVPALDRGQRAGAGRRRRRLYRHAARCGIPPSPAEISRAVVRRAASTLRGRRRQDGVGPDTRGRGLLALAALKCPVRLWQPRTARRVSCTAST